MYDGRKVPRPETEPPFFTAYYGDWYQLSFSYEREQQVINKKGKIKKIKPLGSFRYVEDAFGIMLSQAMEINLPNLPDPIKKWQNFLNEFSRTWLHEWMHVIGISDKGLKILREMWFPV